MSTDWIVTILQGYGLAGIVIFSLGYVVWHQNKLSFKINEARLGEREVLIKALEQNTTAIRDNARATEHRNEVTQELSDALGKYATAFEMFTNKADIRSELIKDQLQHHRMALDALSESNRVNTGIIRETRDVILRDRDRRE